jgi:hypothetical protein
MTTSRPPVAAARCVVGLAARLLPTAADRRRYQAEFIAELHHLPPVEQFRQAVGVLSQTFALRAALGGHTRTEEAGMPSTLRCRALRWHRWTSYGAPAHAHVRVCARCGKNQGPFYSPDERPSYPVYPSVGG